MISMKKPAFFIGTIIDNATDHMMPDRKSRIESVRQALIDKARNYDNLAQRGELYLIEQHASLGRANNADLLALYTQKFVQEDSNRRYYDAIKLSAPFDLCPYCQQTPSDTIDHFLPESKYASFTVTPNNMVPSCSRCNKKKLDYEFDCYENQLFHPYYDDFDKGIWLQAKMIKGDPPAFIFLAEPDSSYNKVTKSRIKNSFSKDGFYLNEVYIPHSGKEFFVRNNRMKKAFLNGGKFNAINELKDLIEDEMTAGNNSWKAAMYRAMIECDWYWDEYLPERTRNTKDVPMV